MSEAASSSTFDEASKTIIVGYMRTISDELKVTIPDPLIMIIYSFFYLMDAFAFVAEDSLQISGDGRSIKRISIKGSRYPRGLGKIDIDPASKTINVWDINVNKRIDRCVIGIVLMPTDNIRNDKDKSAYLVLVAEHVTAISGRSRDWNKEIECKNDDDSRVIFEDDDVITIELNLITRIVRFSFKQKQYDLNLSQADSEKGLKYCLMCGIGNYSGESGQEVSIANFTSREKTSL